MRGSTTLASLLGVLAAVASARPASAQDPIIKPTTTTTTTTTRLPAPTGIVARQIANDRILLTWRPVAGAVKYALWRSVPPAGIVALETRPTDTLYYDSDVRAGSTYYYNVAAVDGSGTIGLRAGGNPVTATVMATTPAPPSSLVASLSADGKSVLLNAVASCDGSRVEFERGDTAGRFFSIGYDSSCPMQMQDALVGAVPGTRIRWRVRQQNQSGMLSDFTLSNELTVPGTTTTTSTSGTTGGTTGPTTSTPTTTAATGGTTFTVAPALSLAGGASAALASLGGTRWVSMNEGVASVDASGAVTGRAAGTAQIVALSIASDGSLRVTTVRVTVQ